MDEENQEMRQLFEERLARYQATIALEPTDRMVVGGTGSNYFAEIYAGYSNQEVIYDINKCIDALSKFAEAFPQVDLLRAGRMWAPLIDSTGFRLYRLPGRELPPACVAACPSHCIYFGDIKEITERLGKEMA